MSGFERFLFEAHSGLRWLVVLASIIAIIWLGRAAITGQAYDRLTHRVVVIWSGLFGLQWILGLILFVVLGGFDIRQRWEHLITMTLALALAHAYVPLKRRADPVRVRGALASVIGVLVLVYLGVVVLGPGRWSF
jgi:hypothetical protein